MTSHGVEIWECRQCGCEMTNILTKNQKQERCESCKEENQRLKQRMNYYIYRILGRRTLFN